VETQFTKGVAWTQKARSKPGGPETGTLQPWMETITEEDDILDYSLKPHKKSGRRPFQFFKTTISGGD
jgi:hypothetical protein